jgi:predicted O-methyltransferase YrrM
MIKPNILRVIEDVEKYQSTVDDHNALPRDAAEFVYALLLATGADCCLEIGTSYGYSGLWILAAMEKNNGVLTTIDLLQRKSDAALARFKEANLDNRATLLTGPALDIIPNIDGPFNFALIDADKENCQNYVEAILPKLNNRGIILTDNTLTHADQMKPFLKWIRNHDALTSAHIPIGNGMELSIKTD